MAENPHQPVELEGTTWVGCAQPGCTYVVNGAPGFVEAAKRMFRAWHTDEHEALSLGGLVNEQG